MGGPEDIVSHPNHQLKQRDIDTGAPLKNRHESYINVCILQLISGFRVSFCISRHDAEIIQVHKR